MASITMRTDGWDEIELENFPAHSIRVLALPIDGRPRIIGLHIEPKGELPLTTASGLTGEKLRKVPIQDLAVLLAGDGDVVFEALAAVHESEEPSKSERDINATVEQVANLYKAAQRAGKPPRTIIKEALHISDRTLDRRIADARASGLLEPYRTDAPKPKSGTKTSSKRRKKG